MYDIVTLGEGMLRLSPPLHERLRRTRTLDLHVCGAQGNVACNLARLGLRSAFATKLPDNALGLLARDYYMSCGVDVAHVRLVPNARMGLNFIEFGATPRASASVYDRRDSAASGIAPGDFDWDGILAGCRFAYTDGIFPALSETCRAVTTEFFAAAKRRGCQIGFDTNFREHLWPAEVAAHALSPLIAQADVLMSSREDAQRLFGCDGEGEQAARQLRERFGCCTICLAQGEPVSVLRGKIQALVHHDGRSYRSRQHEVDAIDRFGAGDALGSGLIYSVLTGKDMQYAVDFAAALSALDFTAPGDVAHVSVSEVEAVMRASGFNVRR